MKTQFLIFFCFLTAALQGQPRDFNQYLARYFYFSDNGKIIIHCIANKKYRIIETFYDSLGNQRNENEFFPCEKCSELYCKRQWFFHKWTYDKLILMFIKNNVDTMKVVIPFSQYDNRQLDTIRFQKGNLIIPESRLKYKAGSLQEQITVRSRIVFPKIKLKASSDTNLLSLRSTSFS